MKFSSYPAYKQSKDELLGEVPEHWQQKWLGLLAVESSTAFVDGPFGSDLKSSDYQDEGIPLIQLNNIRDGRHTLRNMKFISTKKRNQLSRHSAIPGDIVIAKMADPVARSAIVADEFPEYIIVADCVKMSPNLDQVDLRYLILAINSDCVRISAELMSSGVTRIRINLGQIKKLKIPYPPIEEQIQIARFLDHETARIDALIEEQQRLIELLKEKRQAVISHAVTKGLDPSVLMKDSGVEWLGEVPAHWVVSRAKFVSEIFVPQRNKPELNESEGIAWVTMEDMNGGYISETNNKVTEQAASEAGSKLLKKGSVIASCVGRFGVVAINSIDAIVNQQLQAFEPKKIKAEFLRSIVELSKEYFEMIGTTATLIYVNQQGFENLPILLPPENEQESICGYLDEANTQFDALLSQSCESIKLLQERRSALISAAVTGKIDLRGWQPPTSTPTSIREQETA